MREFSIRKLLICDVDRFFRNESTVTPSVAHSTYDGHFHRFFTFIDEIRMRFLCYWYVECKCVSKCNNINKYKSNFPDIYKNLPTKLRIQCIMYTVGGYVVMGCTIVLGKKATNNIAATKTNELLPKCYGMVIDECIETVSCRFD